MQPYIGSWDSQYFDGQIDDVRIYNRALGSNEVAQLYASEAVPPSITTQPYSVVAYAHSSASFTAAVAGLYSGELFRGGIRGMKCGATGQMIGLGRGDRGVVWCEDRVELEGDLFPELVTGDGEV